MELILSNRILLSHTGKKMTSKNRNKQELKWYTGKIYLCTHFLNHGRIADEIEEECKRRKIPFKTIFVKEQPVVKGVVTGRDGGPYPYEVRKVVIPQSPETTELEKKQLVDWTITTFNTGLKLYCNAVWIQPSCEVDPIDVDDKSGIVTHRVKYL